MIQVVHPYDAYLLIMKYVDEVENDGDNFVIHNIEYTTSTNVPPSERAKQVFHDYLKGEN